MSTTAAQASVSPARSPPTVTRYLIACLCSAIGIAVWNVMPVLLGAGADERGLTNLVLGRLGTAMLAGWLSGTALTWVCLPRVRRQRFLLFASLIAAVGFGLAGHVDTTVMLAGCLFLAGVGAALVYCVSIQLIAELGEPERGFGLKVTSEVFSGAALLFGFSAVLVPAFGFPGAAWGLAVVYLLVLFIPSSASARITRSPDSSATRLPDSTPGRVHTLLVLGLLVFLCGITGLWAFLERIGRSVGTTPGEIAGILALLKVVGGAAGITAAVVGARFGLVWPHVVTALTILGACVLFATVSAVRVFALGAWLWEFGFSLGFAYQAAAIARLDPSNRLLLLVPACIGVSGVIGPAVAGQLAAGGKFQGVYVFAVVTALASSVIFIGVRQAARNAAR